MASINSSGKRKKVTLLRTLSELSNKYRVKDVYVAHHQDDLLETYIMQKQRNITPEHFGINDDVKYKDFNIKRPLLHYSKNDIMDYCHKHNIYYGIDESNLENDYKRNKIRHEIVNKMSDEEVSVMLEEINLKNNQLKEINNQTEKLYQKFIVESSLTYILDLNEDEIINILRLWFKKNDIYNLSNLEYLNIVKYIKSDNNSEYAINKEYSLFNDYNKLTLANNCNYKYEFTFEEIVSKDFKYFKITNTGTSFEAVTVSEEDFPITIRNYKNGDKIEMRYGNKRISRWFIDNKIPQVERRSWPIVLNKHKEVILVPKIGCNVAHFSNNPNMFVVK